MPDPQVYWPGDFPAEFFIMLGLSASCFLLLASGAFWFASRRFGRFNQRARACLIAAAALFLLTAPLFTKIYERNTGRWANLKAFLQVREAALRKFRNEHPNLAREQVVKQFRLTDAGPWEFQFDPSYAPVVVYPTLMANGPRMAVNFGGPGSDIAIFEPNTMWVLFSL